MHLGFMQLTQLTAALKDGSSIRAKCLVLWWPNLFASLLAVYASVCLAPKFALRSRMAG